MSNHDIVAACHDEWQQMQKSLAAKKAARRKEAMKRIAKLLGVELAVILVFIGLNKIGFISAEFLQILVTSTVITGSYFVGVICGNCK